VSFDYPGGLSTAGLAINSSGAITGNYFDSAQRQHGFLRNPDGTFTGFDVPGARNTSPLAINDAGTITGSYDDFGGVVGGFVRDPGGAISTFTGGTSPSPRSINSQGVIVGTYQQNSTTTSCFLRDTTGAITTFNILGSNRSICVSINDSGAIAGLYSSLSHGFVRDAAGNVTTFDPDSQFTAPAAINNGGTIAGAYKPNAGRLHSGFIRSAAGAFTTFSVPSAFETFPKALNLTGAVAGYWIATNGVLHAFLRSPTGSFTPLDPTGATSAIAFGINADGAVTGYWEDADHNGHGFLFKDECAAPTITSLTPSTNSLWPPNNKLVEVRLTATTDAGCGSVSCRILSVTSNEPISQGVDWVLTGPLTLNLRATRSGLGNGRVYTITVQCTDGSANSVTKTVTVTVLHDQGH